MHAFLIAAEDGTSSGFDWSGLLIGVIAGSVAIVVAIVNTRGETAALRKLKSMNDVLEKMPGDSDVALSFRAARDLLAERVAIRMTGPKPWKTIPAWGFGVTGAVLAGGALIAAIQVFPPALSEPGLFWNSVILVVLAGTVAWSFAESILVRGEARRRVEEAKKAHPSRRQ